MNSTYLTGGEKVKHRKPVSLLIVLSFIFTALFGSMTAFSSVQKPAQTAQAFDLTQWGMCYFGKDSIPGMMYQYTQSTDMQFALRSKSSITGGVDNVETGLNWILDLFGPGFKEVNEGILGYSLDTIDASSEEKEDISESEKDGNFNKGAKVNPFDRFGVAGLKFSSYSGEWKHVAIDACDSNAEPQDPKAGVFYDDRLEPLSTWDDIGKSEDIRTMQFGKGIGSQFGSAFNNVISNGIFTVTKTIIVFTIALINFSFTNILDLMGITEILSGDGTSKNTGLFGVLFGGIFMPLIIIVFAFTGGHIFYKGIVKREYRSSFSVFIRSIVLFLIAVIISVKPAMFISLPNNIAVVTQSLIITAMNSGLAGGNGLCATDIGQFKTKLVNNPNAKPEGILEQASENMRSAVGCQLWSNFLVKPWAQAQWGVDWDKTWANGKNSKGDNISIPGWSDNGKALKNSNGSMVGNAEVPLGDGSVINNWAIFNISVQTNVHSPLGHEGKKSKYTSGVANDWWRIVDAVANYSEADSKYFAIGDGEYGSKKKDSSTEVTFKVPSEEAVLNEWDHWVGNKAGSRIWTALSSVIISLIGVAAPLIFAFLTAVYSIGVAILMAFAPIMLLIGCWAGKGWEIFKGWGSLVINTTVKRIIAGGLLAISIGLTAAILKYMETTNWWEGVLLMIVVSFALVKSRHKLYDALGSFNLSSVNLGQTAQKLSGDSLAGFKTAGRVSMNLTTGAVNSKRYGGTISQGIKAAGKQELENASYKSKDLRNIMTSYEQHTTHNTRDANDIFRGQEICSGCGKKLSTEEDQLGTNVFHGGRTANGDLICYQCLVDGVDPEAVEVTMDRPDEKTSPKKSILEEKQEELRSRRYANHTVYTNEINRNLVDRITKKVDRNGNPIDSTSNTEQLKTLMNGVNFDIAKYKKNNTALPVVPQEIYESINHEILEEAWRQQNYDWIRQAYTAAWAQWFVETTGDAVNGTLEELLMSVQSEKNNPNAKE